MPNIKSAKKRVRTSESKRKNNINVKGAMRTAIKKLTKNTETDDSSVNNTIKKIDKALKKGIIKKNTAARKKSRIARNANKTK